MHGKVSRRLVVGAIGTSAVAVPLAAVVAADASASAITPDPRPGDVAAVDASALLAPLAPGSALARWTIVAVRPLERGALGVVMADATGQRFDVEILARDLQPLGVRPIVETSRFAIYMKNGGDGERPTLEDHGLGAMTLGQIVARNEGAVDAAAFLTYAERYARHPGLRRPVSADEIIG